MKKLLFSYYLLGVVTLRADLVMSLTANIQSGQPGTEIVFRGTLTNTSATDKLFLNDISPSWSGAAGTNATFEPNSFFQNVPGVLLPNETYSDSELFRVLLKGTMPAGTYNGSLTIRGGANIQANNDLASAGFTLLSPDASAALSFYSVTEQNNYLTISFTQNSSATGVSLIVEGSDDLINWDANKAELVSVPDPNPPNSQTYRFKTPIGASTHGYLRVRVVRGTLSLVRTGNRRREFYP